ncbi:hypothetical protein I6N96_11015 [Enterococcus sp. BWM-S5]|uniref:Uncharacterized protein n=1 Tax=Enterococcus larvae TaxID=2794352 RepID=A0ABS4CKJ3_9ENTE|nr:hypothetical protein [Enterococcus larvae]MBP1046797.1 hypothetical protein [Enterococcus larvae]
MVVWFIAFFIGMQVVLEKEWLPDRLIGQGLRVLCLEAILVITVSAVIGVLFRQPVLIVGTVTIFSSSILAWKYRNKYDGFGV